MDTTINPADHVRIAEIEAMRYARNRMPRNWHLEDLVAHGYLGVVRAATKFRPELGFKFNTYAHHYARGAILDAVRANAVYYGRIGVSIDADDIDRAAAPIRDNAAETRRLKAWLRDLNADGAIDGRALETLWLAYGENLSDKDIGRVIKCDRSTAWRMRTEAMRVLREKLVRAGINH